MPKGLPSEKYSDLYVLLNKYDIIYKYSNIFLTLCLISFVITLILNTVGQSKMGSYIVEITKIVWYQPVHENYDTFKTIKFITFSTLILVYVSICDSAACFIIT
jgi:hypothetical protein